MNTLFSTASDIKPFINIVGTFNFESVSPYIETAQERYLNRYLGDTLLDKLLYRYNNPGEADGDAETNEALDALLPYAQKVLAKFAFYLAVPMLDVQLTSAGFAVTSNSNVSPASDKRVAAFRAAMEADGWDLTESMLKFLEKNQTDYPSWVASTAYTTTYATFINTATDFDKIIRINESRLEFQKMIPDMVNVELLRIEPVISKELADAIRDEIKAGFVSVANEKILTLIRRAVAYYTFVDTGRSDILMMDKHRNLADMYLTQVKKILDENIADYPLYEASSSYDSDSIGYASYENEEENTTFTFGG